MRILLATCLSLGLAACGGSSKPAPAAPEEPSNDESLDDVGDSDMPVENEQCCCDYVADPSDDPDDMTEEHSYDHMASGACDEAGGMCVDESSCSE